MLGFLFGGGDGLRRGLLFRLPHEQYRRVMSHYFIDKHDPRVADLFRRLEKAGKALDKLESSGGRTLKGERFVTDEELSRLLKISRRTLQEYRTARIIPYYLIQGKVLYMESEIQKFLEDSRKKCIGGQEWV